MTGGRDDDTGGGRGAPESLESVGASPPLDEGEYGAGPPSAPVGAGPLTEGRDDDAGGGGCAPESLEPVGASPPLDGGEYGVGSP